MTGMGIGRWQRSALLVLACAVGGGAAAAIAAVPGSDGSITACLQTNTSSGLPVTTSANVTVIDPAAGQTCTGTPGAAPAPVGRTITWNVAGPTGPTGPAGVPGPPGPPGGAGAPGPTTTVAGGHTLILAGGQVVTVGGGPTLTVVTPPVHPGGHPVATLTLGSGSDAITTDVLNTSFSVTGGTRSATRTAARTQIHDISIVKKIDKASTKLFLACATGQHFPTATLTFRKTGGQIYLVFRFKLVAVKTVSYDQTGAGNPTQALTLDFASEQIEYK